MKKLWIIIGIFLIMALAISGLIAMQKSKAQNEIKIGVILPLTGNSASYGVALKRGMDLAIESANTKGVNGKKIVAIFEDSQADPQKAVNAFNKLVKVDKVPMVIGDMFSASTLAIAPIAEKQKIVLLSPTASAIELTNAGNYFFRIYPSDSYDGVFLANFAKNTLKANTVSIIYSQAASVSAISQVFFNKFESLGGKIMGMNSYKEGDTDFRSQLIKANTTNPDIIFIPGYLNEMAKLLVQSKELGVKKQFLSISTFYDPKILELTGGASEGVLFSAPFFDPASTSSEVKSFVDEFRAKYNKAPDILAGYGYDVVNITVVALKSVKTVTPDNIKVALYAIKNFPGVTGKTSFDSNGDVVKELKIMRVKDNKFSAIE